mgnify:CR=1 FL=1
MFIPKYQKNSNWYSKDYVDELQKFYQRERDNLKDRIDRIYKENDDAKLELLNKIDELKNQVRNNKEQLKEEAIILIIDFLLIILTEKNIPFNYTQRYINMF